MFKKIVTLLRVASCILWSLSWTAACEDDAGFSAAPSYRLAFSCDTVQFDTVFTATGSSTRLFQIYNRNDVSLNIASIVQANATESGFRVNVDGQYATHLTDVEIRDNDSLYVFVEITPKSNGSGLPQTVTDSLIFTLESGVRQCVKMVACGQDAVRLYSPCFSGNDTLYAEYPYIVYDSLTVDSGAVLTVEAGATICFHKGAECLVRGILHAIGTAEKPIVFRGDRTDKMFAYLPYDHIPGQWGGIRLTASSFGNQFVFCDIHAADYGIRCELSEPSQLKLSLENSIIQNVKGNGLELNMCAARIGNCLLANAGGHCVSVLGGIADFIHCTIANFYVWEQKGAALAFYNTRNDTIYPLHGLNFANCLITGYTDDEIAGVVSDKSDTTDLSEYAQYSFDYSFVNSKERENPHFTHIVWDTDSNAVCQKDNFLCIDHDKFLYDFHLDSLSAAIGMAFPEYASLYPLDLDGNDRCADGTPDAGCFEFAKKRE